jgi:hypothetical protein
MVASDLQLPKPHEPIDCTDDGSVTEVRSEQPSKAYSRIDVKPSSIVTVVSAPQYANA